LQPLLQWKGNNYCIFWECVCSLRYPACIAHAPYCHLWPVCLYNTTGCWGRCLGLSGARQQGIGENYILRDLMRWAVHVVRTRMRQNYVQAFGGGTWR